jgi:hypothetical protein
VDVRCGIFTLILLGIFAMPATCCQFQIDRSITNGNALVYIRAGDPPDTLVWEAGEDIHVEFDENALRIEGNPFPQPECDRVFSEKELEREYSRVPLVQDLRRQGKTWNQALKEYWDLKRQLLHTVASTYADALPDDPDFITDRGILAASDQARTQLRASPIVDSAEVKRREKGTTILRVVFRGQVEEYVTLEPVLATPHPRTVTREEACALLQKIDRLAKGHDRLLVLGEGGYQFHSGTRARELMVRFHRGRP